MVAQGYVINSLREGQADLYFFTDMEILHQHEVSVFAVVIVSSQAAGF